MSKMRDDAPLRYYDGDGVDPLPVVLAALRESGRDAERVEIDDLAGIDEFHALGRPATMALAELVGVERGATVIDVGAGLGGPARFLASRYREIAPRVRAICEKYELPYNTGPLFAQLGAVQRTILRLAFPGGEPRPKPGPYRGESI